MKPIYFIALIALVLTGCAALGPSQPSQPPLPRPPSALDRLLFNIQTQQVVQVVTQEVVRTVIQEVEVPVVREVIKHVTNDVGAVHIQTFHYTNYANITNTLYLTNSVAISNTVPVYTYETKPAVGDVQGAVTTIGNMVAPGIGGLLGIAVGGAVGFYKAWKERKMNKVLVQGVQTGRELIRLGNDPEVDARYKEFLKDNQKAVDVFSEVSKLVERNVDKGEAKNAAREIMAEAGWPSAPLPPPV